ncbi:protein RCC2 [Tanacetum coccineum]
MDRGRLFVIAHAKEGCKSIPTVELEFLGQTKRMNLKCFITYVVRNVLSMFSRGLYNEKLTSNITRKLTNVGTLGTYAVIKNAEMTALKKYKVVKAGSGGHTVVQTEDGCSFSFGWNKHGQLGTGSIKNEVELSPVQCLITDVRDVACGNDFTVWLTSLKGASISMKTTLRVF